MKVVDLVFKRKSLTVTIFFILAYTISILTFSIGNSAITSERNKVKNFNKDNNKLISFLENKVEIDRDTLVNIINDDNVSIILQMYKNINENNLQFYSELKSDGFFYKPDMKEGKYFEKQEFSSSEDIAIFSPTVNSDDNNFKVNEDIELKGKGITYERNSKIVIPKKVFFKILGSEIISDNRMEVIINGSENNINLALDKINNYIKERDSNSKITVTPYVTKNVNYEANILFKASFFIILITIINSISISALWVEETKEEIILRKVFGGKDSDLFRSFFSELSIIAVIAMIIALIIQWILSLITRGYIFNIDLRLHFNNFIYSFILAIVTAYGSALPAFKYLVKVQPADLLRED